MVNRHTETGQVIEPEPRWPAQLGVLAFGGLFLAVPEPLSPGPNWVVLAVVAALAMAATIAHRKGATQLNHHLGIALSLVMTAALIWSLGALIAGLVAKKDSGVDLLRSGGALWVTNILVFASWYWRLDAGGPHKRALHGRHIEGEFLFPQMTLPSDRQAAQWRPGFVDYLFLAFNTSTAFSPTDVAPLASRAKALMMVQSLISLTTIAIVAGRAVNVL